MTEPGTFMVDLDALGAAIGTVSGERDAITGSIGNLKQTFNQVEAHWQGPAGNTFPPLTAKFNQATATLMSVLDEAVDRMRTAQSNYQSTEEVNKQNLSTKLDERGQQSPPVQNDTAEPGQQTPLAAPQGRELPTATPMKALNSREPSQ
jgi:WXG100 family type VII secretion target